jgi:hypothetical protein
MSESVHTHYSRDRGSVLHKPQLLDGHSSAISKFENDTISENPVRGNVLRVGVTNITRNDDASRSCLHLI